MKKPNIIIFLFILIISFFSLIKSKHLRKNDEIIIPDIDSLLIGLPKSYSILQKEMKSQKCSISKELSLSYFKALESNSNIKYYLNKEKKDFDSIIKDVIKSMGISNPQHAYVVDILNDKISEDKEYFHTNKWVNFNIITTARSEENSTVIHIANLKIKLEGIIIFLLVVFLLL